MAKIHETNKTFIQQLAYLLFTDAAILSLPMIFYNEKDQRLSWR